MVDSDVEETLIDAEAAFQDTREQTGEVGLAVSDAALVQLHDGARVIETVTGFLTNPVSQQ